MAKMALKKPPKTNLAVLIPTELHEWLSHHAIDVKTSARAIVQRLLEDYKRNVLKKRGA